MARIPAMTSYVRIVIGNCPRCGAVLAETNHGETWPLMKCDGGCHWQGPTTDLFNHHLFSPVRRTWLGVQAPACQPLEWAPQLDVVERLKEGRDPVTGL